MKTEIKRLTPRLHEGEPMLGFAEQGNYTFYATAADLQMQVQILQRRLAEAGEREIDLQAKVIQLESDIQGPDGFKTWQAAAFAERAKRLEGVKRIAHLEEREMAATGLIERWLKSDEKHDWTGFERLVKDWLGVDIPEPIPEYIHYVLEHDNFYDGYNKGQGEEFYQKWRHRCDEFPKYNSTCLGTWP